MIGSDLEGADLESRVASWAASAISDDAAAVRAVIEAYGDRLAAADVAGDVSQCTGNAGVIQPELETVVGSQQLTATYDAAFETCAWTYVPIRRHHRQRRPRGSQGNKPGDDHDPRYRRNATSASPAAARSGRHGGHWKITQYMYQQMPEQSEGAAPASSDSATRIRARSRIRLRSPSTTRLRLRRRLRARTGAVQVDAGVAGAVPCACSWTPALLAVTALAHRCTEGNVKAGPPSDRSCSVSAAGEVSAEPGAAPRRRGADRDPGGPRGFDLGGQLRRADRVWGARSLHGL
jgi:hypothetical protein